MGASGDQRTGEDNLPTNLTARSELRSNVAGSENCFSDLPSGERISQLTVASAEFVLELSNRASTAISGLPSGMFPSNSLCTKIPSGAIAMGAVLSNHT